MSPRIDGLPMNHPTSTDSAGQPWAGRHFEPNASVDDDGSAPPELLAAIERFRAGAGGESQVVDAVRTSRFLIPLLAALGQEGVNEKGQKIDKSQELSIVTVEGPDGRTVLPVFSSVATMAAWNAHARPVPAVGSRVALAAASEETDLVVIDPTSPTEFAVRRPALWALAQEREWTPGYLSTDIAAEFAKSIADEPAVVGLALAPGDPECRLHGPELEIQLTLTGGLSEPDIRELLERLSLRWSQSTLIAEGVDSMGVSLHPAV